MILNRNGFVTGFLLSMTPLLLIVLSVIAASSLLLLKWRKTHELCQISLLGAQRVAAEKINDLFDLNPQARELRLELTAAKAALAAAVLVGPEAVVAARANLKAVQARQMILRSRQEMLKARAVLDTNRDLLVFGRDLKKQAAVTNSTVSYAHLFVRAMPASSVTPDHEPLPNFTKRQLIKSAWTIDPSALFPDWLKNWFKKIGKVRGQCTATLIQKGETWNATLGEGKSSWNSWSPSVF